MMLESYRAIGLSVVTLSLICEIAALWYCARRFRVIGRVFGTLLWLHIGTVTLAVVSVFLLFVLSSRGISAIEFFGEDFADCLPLAMLTAGVGSTLAAGLAGLCRISSAVFGR